MAAKKACMPPATTDCLRATACPCSMHQQMVVSSTSTELLLLPCVRVQWRQPNGSHTGPEGHGQQGQPCVICADAGVCAPKLMLHMLCLMPHICRLHGWHLHWVYAHVLDTAHQPGSCSYAMLLIMHTACCCFDTQMEGQGANVSSNSLASANQNGSSNSFCDLDKQIRTFPK